MPRLFAGPKEINFVADIAKELTKDVIGEEIILYQISIKRSSVHDVYDETRRKVSEQPIKINAIVDWGEQETRTGKLGHENVRTLIAHVQRRDLIDRGIEVSEGDFIQFGSMFFEIVSKLTEKLVFGHVEYANSFKLTAKQAREGQFDAILQGRLPEEFDTEPEAFVQQRGLDEIDGVKTGDKRELVDNKTLDAPLTAPRKLNKDGSFYDE